MSKFFSQVFFFCLSFFSSLSGLTTSVVLTCNATTNIGLIPEIIESYANQTIVPDEIVISIASASKVKYSEIKRMQTITNKFPILFVPCSFALYSGEGKNMACKSAKGDIILFNEANFKPKKERIEIIKRMPLDDLTKQVIKKLFETKNVDLLIYNLGINGDFAIRRYVFDKVKWLDTGDNLKFIYDVKYEGFSYTNLDQPLLTVTSWD